HRCRQRLLRRAAGTDCRSKRTNHRARRGGGIFAELARPGARSRLAQCHGRLGEPHDPRLPAHSLDLAILVHMYHEITQPYGLFYNLAPALKSGGRVGVVDASAPTAEHGTPPNLLRCELAAVGYRQIGFHPLSGSDAYLAIFAPPPDDSRPRPDAITACPQ